MVTEFQIFKVKIFWSFVLQQCEYRLNYAPEIDSDGRFYVRLFFFNHNFLKATLTALLPQKEKHSSSKKWNAFRQSTQAASKG